MDNEEWIQALKQEARKLRFTGLFIVADASNGVFFADAKDTREEAEKIAEELKSVSDPSYENIEIVR